MEDQQKQQLDKKKTLVSFLSSTSVVAYQKNMILRTETLRKRKKLEKLQLILLNQIDSASLLNPV